MGIRTFLDGHRRFTASVAQNGPEVLKRLAADGQKPEALVVCCSDSRVIPELITGAGPGSLFVVRNVGNLVPPFASGNQSVGAAITYAVDHLHVSHLIVLGHYGCGGMNALKSIFGGEHAHAHDDVLPRWLQYARPSWDELVASRHAEDADWLRRLVEENVLQQLAHAVEYPPVRAAVEAGRLTLHAWTYEIADGSLRFWDMDADAFVDRGAAAAAGGTVTLAEVEEQDAIKG